MDKFIARAPVTVLGRDYRSGDSFEADAADVEGQAAEMLRPPLPPGEGWGEGTRGDESNAPVTPADPAERQAAIVAAIEKLNVDNPDVWLRDGRPNASSLTEIVGWTVSAAERDAAWAAIQAEQ